MTPYEELLQAADQDGIAVLEYDFIGNTKGIYCDGVVILNKNCSTVEKCCTLAEELGHYHTASANIIELDTMDKKKQELLGHRWGIEKLLPFHSIIDTIISYKCDNMILLAELLEVTPEYLLEALTYYKQKYGAGIDYNGYSVVFTDISLSVRPLMDEIV